MTKKEDIIKFTKQDNDVYKLTFYTGIEMGEFYKEIDGYYVYWPIQRNGFWESYVLRIIADKLDELNEPYDKEVQEYFKEKMDNE